MVLMVPYWSNKVILATLTEADKQSQLDAIVVVFSREHMVSTLTPILPTNVVMNLGMGYISSNERLPVYGSTEID